MPANVAAAIARQRGMRPVSLVEAIECKPGDAVIVAVKGVYVNARIIEAKPYDANPGKYRRIRYADGRLDKVNARQVVKVEEE